ncbi:MAG: elongation factor G [Fimbriimonadales bacterium]
MASFLAPPKAEESTLKQATPDKIRNVALVGHGGAGKTMLAEHLLHTAGAIERVGSVEAGTTHSDFDPLENKRQISLSASVLPVDWKGSKVNLIDVPGYPDFIGDLHGVARVVESMIIVAEAKADLDVGFDLAWEAADAAGLGRAIFVNKLERDNADYEGLLNTLKARYGTKIVPLHLPLGKQAGFSGVVDVLTMKAYKGRDRESHAEEIPAELASEAAAVREKLIDAAAEADDELAMKYLGGEELTTEEIHRGLRAGVQSGHIVPVLVGSAATGVGCGLLLDEIVNILPSPVDKVHEFDGKRLEPDPNAPLVAFVFKSTADPYVGKVNYIRIFSGTLKVDDHVDNTTQEHDERVHNLYFVRGKHQEPASAVSAGDICAAAKLQNTKTGDTLAAPKSKIVLPPVEFPEPIYRIAIRPVAKTDEDKLGPALGKLLEEDPTLRYVRDAALHQEILEGMGDIHLENVIDKLKTRFGVNVTIEDAKVPYRETIRGKAQAQGRHKRQTGGKGQFGDCWIRLEPLPRGAGFEFGNEVVGGAIPKNFIPAVEKGIRETMEQGFLAGYPVVDLKATVYDGSYHEVDSSEMAFKIAGSLAFKNAAEKCSPVILEPILELEVDVPDECVGDVVGDLNGRRGRLQGMDPIAPGKTRVRALVPMATMMRYALDLRSITKGRGRFRQKFSHYDELPPNEQQELVKQYQKMLAEREG